MDRSHSSCLEELRAAESNILVQQALRGCADSFAEIANRFYPRLVHLIENRIAHGSHMDAEDIAQEALTRAFQNLDQFDPQFRFSTWLYTIALRIAWDHNRGHRRRLVLVETKRSLLEQASEGSVPPSSPCEQQEAVEILWRSARKVLSDLQYTALWLRFGEDLTVKEVAKILGKTKVGIRVLLHRARIKWIEELNKEAALRSPNSNYRSPT